MSYLALYRKFRPAGFDGLIGQDHIVKILTGQVKSGNIGHAYLFCGSRGTGKTSAAKILARAVNCLNPIDGSPCNTCKVCLSLSGNSSMDIMEIDAASNNKVEEVREIRDNVQYPPVNGRYKVYIIDEVHMLTDSAFNALLKTLEEPPSHALFILATTEVHKLPATILSRCMRFDFKLVSVSVLQQHLCKVLDAIGKEYQIEAVQAIARNAEGSVRDMLSIADMCVSLSEGKLTYSDVLSVLSASDSAKIFELAKSILGGDIKSVLLQIDELTKSGKSVAVINKDLTAMFRDFLVIKSAGDSAKDYLMLPEEVFSQYKGQAGSTDMQKLLRCVELFSAQESVIRLSLHPRIALESVSLKAAQPIFDSNTDALEHKINQLYTEIEKLQDKLANQSFGSGTAAVDTPPVNMPAKDYSIGKNIKEQAPPPRLVKDSEPASAGISGDNPDFGGDNLDFGGYIPPPDESYAPPESAGFYPPDYEPPRSRSAPYAANSKGQSGGAKPAQKQPGEGIARPQDKAPAAVYGNTKAGGGNAVTNNNEPAYNKANGNAMLGTGAADKRSGDGFGSDSALTTLKQSVGNTQAAAIWGAVIRSLRDSRSGMLYTLCRDLRADFEGNNFIILADDDMSYEILNKPKNIAEIQELVSQNAQGRQLKVRVSGNASSMPDVIDEGLEKIKELAGDKLIIK